MIPQVMIGTEPRVYLAGQVLEWSLRSRTRCDLQVHYLEGPRWEVSTQVKQGTEFSLRRWLIPEFLKWQGRAIYLDADIVVLESLEDLLGTAESELQAAPGRSSWMVWQADRGKKRTLPQSSVMLIDCEAARNQWGWHREQMLAHLEKHPERKHYDEFMHGLWQEPLPGELDPAWNCFERPGKNRTCALHYTNMARQPWFNPGHQYAGLWRKELTQALKHGFVQRQEVEQALREYGKLTGLHPAYRDVLR